MGGTSLGKCGGMKKPPDLHYHHRFQAELIRHAVWLCHVFSLSFRDVELLLAERGVLVSYESIRLEGPTVMPHVFVTDKLKSYGVEREILPDVEHRQSRYLNNRAENSHRPTRRRERQMQRFNSPRQAPRFLSAHSFIYGHFHPRRHRMTASSYRLARATAFEVWTEETCAHKTA
jgi:putative transposase